MPVHYNFSATENNKLEEQILFNFLKISLQLTSVWTDHNICKAKNLAYLQLVFAVQYFLTITHKQK